MNVDLPRKGREKETNVQKLMQLHRRFRQETNQVNKRYTRSNISLARSCKFFFFFFLDLPLLTDEMFGVEEEKGRKREYKKERAPKSCFR